MRAFLDRAPHYWTGSEGLEPLDDRGVLTPRSDTSRRSGDRLCLGDRLPLHLEVDCGVAVGRVDAGVPEPMADGGEIDSGLEEMDGRGMAHRVRVKTLTSEARHHGLRA